jgi:hypothetical protein
VDPCENGPIVRNCKNLIETFRGPPIDDPQILEDLPADLREFLEEQNGFVRYGGGLHVRGACREPLWHSLREVMEGATSLHRLYPDVVDPTDIPFAQDCSGDQFLIRGGEVHQLAAEVGEIDPMDRDLKQFLEDIEKDPIENLCMHPLQAYAPDGGSLPIGKLLLAYPPFCTGKSGGNASLRVENALEVIKYHADFARQIAESEDGEDVMFQMAP